MKKTALSDLTVCPALESSVPAEKLRQIIVPVDLTNDCTASIDYAVLFCNAFGSTLNLLHLYQEPYVHHGKRLEHLLFGRHADRILANAPCPVLVVREGERWVSSDDTPRVFDEMKKIEAIIVPAKLNAVRAELERRGINGTMILTEVQQATEQRVNWDFFAALPDRERRNLSFGKRKTVATEQIRAIMKFNQLNQSARRSQHQGKDCVQDRLCQNTRCVTPNSESQPR